MMLDAYSFCPGGTGKKIKHCECRDIAGELDKIIKAVEGDQRVAALDRINHTLATKAHRPCLLALKIITLLGMKDMQGLEDTVTTFVKVAPDNPLAHTFAAILEARKHRPREAVDEIQLALSCMKEVLPGELCDAVGEVAQVLINSGEYLAARAHVMLWSVISDEREDVLRAITTISRAEQIPLALKQELQIQLCPADATWKGRFEAAHYDTRAGYWKQGLQKFEKLHADFPGQPAILWNIALLRSYLAMPHLHEAWHAYATCEGADFDAAVNAEVLAQSLTYEADLTQVALVDWTVNVSDANALNEQLLSSKCLVPYTGDLSELRKDDAPPPKSVFDVLDRPALGADDAITPLSVPLVLATVRLYGRETDRSARLEVTVPKTDVFDQMRSKLVEIAGALITSEETEAIVQTIPRLLVELRPKCHFPQATPIAVRHRIGAQVVQQVALESWPKIPLSALEGKTPEQVVGDPAYRIQLAAALITLEQHADIYGWTMEVDAIRQKVGVPVPEPLEPPAGDALVQLAPGDWVRVIPEKLADPDLARLFERAVTYSAHGAVGRLGKELLSRPSLADQVNRSAVCMILAELSKDLDESLDLVLKARRFAAETKQSPAKCLLAELPLRFLRGEVAEAQQVMNALQANHRNEPGVMQSLFNLLVRLGIVSPDGRVASDLQSAEPEPAAPAAAALWTPDAPRTAAEGQKPSKLWVPD